MEGVASGAWTARVQESSRAEEPDRRHESFLEGLRHCEPGESGMPGQRNFGTWPSNIESAQNE
jgi:hypothetical protein